MAETLTKQAYRQIINMIFLGVLKPGNRLQETRLGEILNMSRTPVREAIHRIEVEGLAIRQGRFWVVKLPTPAEMEEIFFLRGELESYCVVQAVHLPSHLLDGLEMRIKALRNSGRDGGRDSEPDENEEPLRLDDDFHLTLALSSHNGLMVNKIVDLRRRSCMFNHEQVPHRFIASCDEHLAIIAALRDKDGQQAAFLMREHILQARDAVLQKLERTILP